MSTRAEILAMDNRSLAALLRDGHAIDPRALDDTTYRGVSLGLPALIERATWTTFRKVFHRDPIRGVLRGWNVRVEQHGVDAPNVPLLRDGQPFTFGHYLVVENQGAAFGAPRGLVLDYRLGHNSPFDPVSRLVDPLVAVTEGSAELLVGRSYFDAGLGSVPTPSFFVLDREGPLEHVVPPPRA